ncbi:hypothetical protein BJ508DRAFT_115016 [Ascobolus immersus RN42]|uniref:CFEM domain-containing protein n=1 Tax=Ascobolus immersus RN42 TaxID=1160509 RepID=A0A3N4I549_ASCIM|nr:hypothetical protein BJ508DRAFT_115016 [Ascobolus immersus RN42]
MKYSFAAVAITLAAGVSAQGLAALADLPGCALKCLTGGLATTGCGTEIGCACAKKDFVDGAVACVTAACTEEETLLSRVPPLSASLSVSTSRSQLVRSQLRSQRRRPPPPLPQPPLPHQLRRRPRSQRRRPPLLQPPPPPQLSHQPTAPTAPTQLPHHRRRIPPPASSPSPVSSLPVSVLPSLSVFKRIV